MAEGHRSICPSVREREAALAVRLSGKDETVMPSSIGGQRDELFEDWQLDLETGERWPSPYYEDEREGEVETNSSRRSSRSGRRRT